jgi:hypothetical protein
MQFGRALSAGIQEVRKFFPQLWRITRQIFQEVVGFIFLAFAIWFIFGREGLIGAFQDLDGDGDSVLKLVLTGLFVLMLVGFGISSFLRARRISRER